MLWLFIFLIKRIKINYMFITLYLIVMRPIAIFAENLEKLQ